MSVLAKADAALSAIGDGWLPPALAKAFFRKAPDYHYQLRNGRGMSIIVEIMIGDRFTYWSAGPLSVSPEIAHAIGRDEVERLLGVWDRAVDAL